MRYLYLALGVFLVVVISLAGHRSVHAAPGTLIVEVVDDSGKPVAFARAVLRRGNSSRDAEGKRGKIVFSWRENQGVETLEVFDARGKDGKQLPLAPWTGKVGPDQDRVSVQLKRGFSIEGIVKDAKGKPLAKVTVFAERRRESMFGAQRYSSTLTDRDGVFLLVGVAKMTYHVGADAKKGYAASMKIETQGDSNGLELTLNKAKPSIIKVRDANRKPLAGAQVVIMKSTPGPSSFSRSIFSEPTPRNGRIEIPALDPGLQLSLEIRPPEARRDLIRFYKSSWTPENMTVDMDEGFEATIRVQDEKGKPLEATIVQLISMRNRAEYGDRSLVRSKDDTGFAYPGACDKKGMLKVPRLPGDVAYFRATMKGIAFPGGSCWFEATRKKPKINITLYRTGSTMRVRVAEDAIPCTGLLVPRFGNTSFMPPSVPLEFDEGCIAIAPDIAPGAYSILVVGKDNNKAGRLDDFTFNGDEVVVPMTTALDVSVNVSMPKGGGDISGAIEHDGTFIGKLKLKKGTIWHFPGLPAGTYHVSVFAVKETIKIKGENGEKDFEHKTYYEGRADVEAGSEPHNLELTFEEDE